MKSSYFEDSFTEQEKKWLQSKRGSNPSYKYLDDSRYALGKYINCDKNDLIYVPNPTHAVANVINNVSLNKGDEVLTTDLEYGSCDRMWFYEAEQKSFSYIRSKVSLPVIDNESFCKEFWDNATERTKYIFRYTRIFGKKN